MATDWSTGATFPSPRDLERRSGRLRNRGTHRPFAVQDRSAQVRAQCRLVPRSCGVTVMKLDVHKWLLRFSMISASFAYGVAAGHYEIFPFGVIHDAKLAMDAWSNVLFAADSAEAAEPISNSIVRTYDPSAGDEWILISGGDNYLKRTQSDVGCVAWLMDRQGNVRHMWRNHPGLWNDARRVERVPGKSSAYPVGIHLFEDGSLLVNYQSLNSYPYALGLAKFDHDSNVLWKKELLSHHWFAVADDGRIFIPALRTVDCPYVVGESGVKLISEQGQLFEDLILELNADGEVHDKWSMLEALADSGYLGLFQASSGTSTVGDTPDPTHLNDIRLVGKSLAATNPMLTAGDLLVSFRSINTVGILDPVSRRFKWLSTGTTLRQHSPRFFDGGVLVLDNLGGSPQTGGSRLVHIDLSTGRPTTIFPRASSELPGLFGTGKAGHIDIHPDGRRALVTITRQSKIWEVDLTSGRVLWEYIHAHHDEQGRYLGILTAEYCYRADFPLNRQEVNRESHEHLSADRRGLDQPLRGDITSCRR